VQGFPHWSNVSSFNPSGGILLFQADQTVNEATINSKFQSLSWDSFISSLAAALKSWATQQVSIPQLGFFYFKRLSQVAFFPPLLRTILSKNGQFGGTDGIYRGKNLSFFIHFSHRANCCEREKFSA
jgi:hypothetical protein